MKPMMMVFDYVLASLRKNRLRTEEKPQIWGGGGIRIRNKTDHPRNFILDPLQPVDSATQNFTESNGKWEKESMNEADLGAIILAAVLRRDDDVDALRLQEDSDLIWSEVWTQQNMQLEDHFRPSYETQSYCIQPQAAFFEN